jgi:hypothetical protein
VRRQIVKLRDGTSQYKEVYDTANFPARCNTLIGGEVCAWNDVDGDDQKDCSEIQPYPQGVAATMAQYDLEPKDNLIYQAYDPVPKSRSELTRPLQLKGAALASTIEKADKMVTDGHVGTYYIDHTIADNQAVCATRCANHRKPATKCPGCTKDEFTAGTKNTCYRYKKLDSAKDVADGKCLLRYGVTPTDPKTTCWYRPSGVTPDDPAKPTEPTAIEMSYCQLKGPTGGCYVADGIVDPTDPDYNLYCSATAYLKKEDSARGHIYHSANCRLSLDEVTAAGMPGCITELEFNPFAMPPTTTLSGSSGGVSGGSSGGVSGGASGGRSVLTNVLLVLLLLTAIGGLTILYRKRSKAENNAAQSLSELAKALKNAR